MRCFHSFRPSREASDAGDGHKGKAKHILQRSKCSISVSWKKKKQPKTFHDVAAHRWARSVGRPGVHRRHGNCETGGADEERRQHDASLGVSQLCQSRDHLAVVFCWTFSPNPVSHTFEIVFFKHIYSSISVSTLRMLLNRGHFSALPTSSTPSGGGRHSAQPDPERGRDPSLSALLSHHGGNAALSFWEKPPQKHVVKTALFSGRVRFYSTNQEC